MSFFPVVVKTLDEFRGEKDGRRGARSEMPGPAAPGQPIGWPIRPGEGMRRLMAAGTARPGWLGEARVEEIHFLSQGHHLRGCIFRDARMGDSTDGGGNAERGMTR